jgi:S-DNA-T family DNA segregation ATPase FtsK/SpoIIIE
MDASAQPWPYSQTPVYREHVPAHGYAPAYHAPQPEPRGYEPALPFGALRPAAYDAAPSTPAAAPIHAAYPGDVRDDGFDARTDLASRTIAERFAPGGGARPVPPTATSAPAPASGAAPGTVGRKLGPGLLGGLSFRRAAPAFKRPSLNLLKRPAPQKTAADHTPAMQRGTARLLEDVLNDFGVKGEIKDIRPGPVVTLFEFEPARGTKSSRVIALADDIARSMSATAVRVAVVPGRNAIGIELPNARRETVLLRELLEAEAFRSSDATLPITLGKSIGGEPVIADLARMPHLLVAGTTGSGKSVGVNTMVLSLLFRLAPDECRFLMIDPKMLELSVYNGIPHLITPVVTDPQKAVAALNWAVREMEERYKRMAQLSVRNIDVFNNRVRNAKKRGEMMSRTVETGFDRKTGQPLIERETLDLEPLPYIVIVVDEFADLMVVAGKDIEAAVQRLAQMARAAGIHLIMATQRPSVDIVTGTIKANFPTRISFKVASKIDSRTILNEQGAEQLLGQGDMLFAGSSGGLPVRVHGAFVADDEVEAVVAALKSQGTPRYVDGVTDAPQAVETGGHGDTGGSDDDLYDRAVAVVLRDGKASTSYVQRRLSIGYNRAADLIERMEREGLISPANNVGKREILAGRDVPGSNAA